MAKPNLTLPEFTPQLMERFQVSRDVIRYTLGKVKKKTIKIRRANFR
jgi:hypothetical protein